MRDTLKKAFVITSPIMAGYIFLGSAFGVLLQSHDFTVVVGVLMSLFIYSGAMQFAAVPLLVNPISLVQTFILTVSISARHLFYGLSMIPYFKNAGKKKLYLIFALTDESYSLLLNHTDDQGLMFLIEMLNQMYWIIGTLIGMFFGNMIPFSIEGIDFSMTALFLIIFIDKLLDKEYYALFSGLIIAFVSLLIFKQEYFIIPSMIGILLGLWIQEKRI